MHTFLQLPCQLCAERKAAHHAETLVLLDIPLAPEVVALLVALHRVRAPRTHAQERGEEGLQGRWLKRIQTSERPRRIVQTVYV